MGSEARATASTSPNDEATRAWDGPLFERFLHYRDILTQGLGNHGEAALALHPPEPGQRVLDIGCGFGDTTRRLGELVGPEGTAVGADIAPRFVELATREAEADGLPNVRFAVLDVQLDDLDGPYDLAFSRFGTMFCASPVAAFRNIRRSLSPGGRVLFVVWRRREDNDWLYRAQTITEALVERPEVFDEPTCGPGPFSQANADTLTEILVLAGFEGVTLRRCDLPIGVGRDLDEAVAFTMALGPAGELLRIAGDRAAHLYEDVRAALREGFTEFSGPDEIRAPASTWIVTATAPTG